MIRNFLFHRVNPKREVIWDPMDVSLFEKCIKFISGNYEVMLIEDLAISSLVGSKEKIATITFDDGYKDNIEFALPILEKYGCKASFYVVTDCIDRNVPTWTNAVERLFLESNVKEIDLDFDFFPDSLKSRRIDTYERKLAFLNILKPFLRKISHENRELILNRVKTSFFDVELPKLMMSWDDLREMRSKGHYVGSHSVSHCMLATVSDEEFVRSEILNSGLRIEQELGYFPISFSYPLGNYDERTIKIAKECGYQIGLAVKQNLFDPKKDSIYEIPRIELYNEPWWKTKLRISNRLEDIKHWIGYR